MNLALHVEDDPSRVRANRARLARRIGSARVTFPQQVHGPTVLVVDETLAGPSGIDQHGAAGVDALITAVPGFAVGVLVADCLPVLLADPAARVVAAVHAGRNGLVAGVLQAAVAAMVEGGAQPDRIAAVIGPAVCGRCYEVPARMRAEVEAVVPGSASLTRDGTPSLDLVAGATKLLRAAGVPDVREVGHCTVEDSRFYSYRRDGLTGRFAGVVMLDGDV